MQIRRKYAAALAGTATVAAGLALLPSVAGAVAAQEEAGPDPVITGHFVSDRDEEAFFDNDGNRLLSLGDELVYTNTTRGPLGPVTDYAHCAFHQVDLAGDSATVVCTQTGEAGRGSLTFQGSARVSVSLPPRLLEPATWAVTGGTGAFLKARGDVRINRFEGAGLDFRSFGTLRLVLRP